MIPEQKTKLEREAESFAAFDTTAHTATGSYLVAKRGYIAGAQTILENPGEWGLTYPHSQKLAEEVLAMESQLAKYREALESIANAEDLGIKVDPLGIALLMKKRAKKALEK